MSDWRDDDVVDEEWPAPAGGEGVRVVGEPGEEPPADPRRPAGRFPLPGEDPGFWGGEQPRRRRRGRGGGGDAPVELPHWTEPPTGQVPRVLGGETADDDFEAWGPVTGQGPRFRSGDADWADGDWAEGELFKDETMGLGALAEHPDDRGAYDEYAPPRRGRGGRAAMHEPPAGPGMLEGAAYEDPYGDYDEQHDVQPADLGPRMVTGVIVGVVALVALLAGRVTGLLLATVIVGICAFELYAALQRAGYHPATLLGLLGSALAVPLAYEAGERGILVAAVLVGAFTLFWYLFGVVHARPIINAALTMMPFLWVGVLGAFAGLMLSVPEVGNKMLLGVVICAVGSDVVGYFVGRSMGRSPLMPHVSPNKTIEGFVAGAITAVVLGAVVGGVLDPWKVKGVGAGLVLGILVAVTAPLGDLVESMVKRDLGVKDLGGFLPGHGGFLDRFDAMLFALPAAYYWALHLFT